MNDYLWDKKGADAEIEKLESTLAELRSSGVTPPDAVQNAFQEKRRWWQFFPLKIAVPAFAALAFCIYLLPFGSFFEKSKRSGGIENVAVVERIETAKDPQPIESKNLISTPVPQEKEIVREVRTGTKRQQRMYIKPKTVRSEPPAARKIRDRKLALVRKPGIPEPELNPELSEEEKYAYAQLVRALDLTSSKLMIVKNKIDGTEPSESLK